MVPYRCFFIELWKMVIHISTLIHKEKVAKRNVVIIIIVLFQRTLYKPKGASVAITCVLGAPVIKKPSSCEEGMQRNLQIITSYRGQINFSTIFQ
jgi:hypothetical protein